MARRRSAFGVILATVGMGLFSAAVAKSQAHEDPGDSSLFIRYCADCHGADGRGNGPAAAWERPPPSDLTRSTLSRSELIRVIDGRTPVKGHTSPSMPAFGAVFSNEAHTATAAERTTEIREGALADEILWLREEAAKSRSPRSSGR